MKNHKNGVKTNENNENAVRFENGCLGRKLRENGLGNGCFSEKRLRFIRPYAIINKTAVKKGVAKYEISVY